MKKELKKKGLTREYILALSKKKREPEWLLKLRLKGLEFWHQLSMPKWAPDISELALDDILMYVETGNEIKSNCKIWGGCWGNCQRALHEINYGERS